MSRTFFAAASAAALFLAPSAHAQDAFQGAYAGVSLSYGAHDGAISGTGAHDRDGRAATLGAYGGWLTRTRGGFVWGPELSLGGIGPDSRKSGGGLGTSQFDAGMLIGARLRGGFVVQNTFLYGGLGLGLTNAVIREAGSSGSDWALGVSYGLGAEMAVSDAWSLRLDAQRFDLGQSDRSFGAARRDTELRHTQVSIGLTRRF